MSGTIIPSKIATETLIINNYKYTLSNIIPHTSVNYAICCYNDLLCVKVIQGLLEGEQYNEWTTDDWMDRFIKEKIETLPEIHVELPLQSETPVDPV